MILSINRKPPPIINPYPFSHVLIDCGALCRLVREGKNQVVVQMANGAYLHTTRDKISALAEINHLALRSA
jgi:hypothetical protein